MPTKVIAPAKTVLTPQQQAKAYLDANKKDHLNYHDAVTYKISTGSLILDIATGQVSPGVTRLVGPTSAGKTSETLEVMSNFISAIPKNRRGVFVKAEGRLSEEVKSRSGLTFVTNPDEWEDGTVLIYESNIYESVANFIMDLVLNNPTKTLYAFAVDSLDGLGLRDDFSKALNEAYKVAGPAVISKKFLQRTAPAIYKLGHLLIITSQITAQPKIDPYAPLPFRLTKGSGGNAMDHYSDNIWEFSPRRKGDQILLNPKEKYHSTKNPIIGHTVRLTIKKTSNERYESVIEYPIRYNQKNGNSIWVEREIVDTLVAYGFLIPKGSWLNVKEDFLEELRAVYKDMPDKLQGIENFYELFETNKPLTKFCFEKLGSLLTAEQVWTGEGDPLEEDDAK